MKPWQDGIMRKGVSRDHDFVTVARRVVEHAIGEHLDGTPLEAPVQRKNKAAVSRGHLGGVKGGPARAVKLTPVQRKMIAVTAARTRWGRPNKKD
jgi:hypothetical protein